MPRSLSEQDIQEFRDQVCACATRLFAEHGYSGVTMRSIAAELGCSAMTPYRYFENKEDIFRFVCIEAFARFGERSAEVYERVEHPLERFRELARGYVRFAVDEPHAYKIMFEIDKPMFDDENDEEVRFALRRAWLLFLETCEECVKQGHLEGNPLTLAHLGWLGLHGLVTLHLSSRLNFDRSLEDLFEPMLDNFIRGSEARPSSVGGVP